MIFLKLYTFDIHLKLLISFDFSCVNKKRTSVQDKNSKTAVAYNTESKDFKDNIEILFRDYFRTIH